MEIHLLIQAELETAVDKLIRKEIDEYYCNYNNPKNVTRYLLSIGFKDNNDLNTNGWQCDFWFTMTHKDHGTLTISGSGFSGGIYIYYDK